MSEEDARAWLIEHFGRAKTDTIANFLAMVKEANTGQNLISPGTIPTIWNRHALDSAQLVKHARTAGRRWIDIGTGGGFPGIIVAALFDGEVIMVEPRRLRAEFLRTAVQALGLANAVVEHGKIENVTQVADVLSARAVATVEKLLHSAGHCAKAGSRWILPRGAIDGQTTIALKRAGKVFHVEQSLSDPGSSILIIDETAT